MTYQLFTYIDSSGATCPGLLHRGQHFSLRALNSAWAGPALFDRSDAGIDELIGNWAGARAQLEALVQALDNAAFDSAPARLQADALSFDAPVTRPGVIYACGANYRDHVEAMARAFNMRITLDPRGDGIPPWHFIKAGRGTLAGHRQKVRYPGHTQLLDWEAELAVIIGKRADNVAVENALDYVAGYSIANDLSARDNLKRDKVDESSPFRFDWIGHKCFTGACPLGPYFTPAQFVASPEKLGIKLWLNDAIKQDSNTSNHLYSVADQIAYLSQRMTLFPGDILLTGTPAGVGMETGTFLKRGDVMKVWIEALGELETTIV
ncbi:5-oxopent-3-ene-1,2,5-tricarboxylate decarboxylase [Caballeronia cordobensis]|uniref:5-oxopent-3-ene-1,2,5-tricarboxylate decarboxylase n=1 Tax=Caballeronia cordobensis TaxID=1353886 RepID=A0A158I5V8_CABCO|nr:fumarylacetoacetate hydrolase family protein [Caballeronia cordobensis]SAL51743.1 5-oxopent-3-ene-1,2,5-tricarboxylate decarboxylase [Caballeronia cordobensis]